MIPAFEDSRGDVWMSAELGSDRRVVQWQRSTNLFHQYPETDSDWVSLGRPAFAEDGTGTVWTGSSRGLARHRDGRFTNISIGDENSGVQVTNLHVDPRGRLWVGTRGSGLYRSDNPEAERPRFVAYTVATRAEQHDHLVHNGRWHRKPVRWHTPRRRSTRTRA